MTADQATQLAKTILNVGEGRDAAVFITALGMAAASAITYGINDKTKRQQARDFFIDEFTNACKKLDKATPP